ncbi:MAG TPA: radical SAM protein [Candidatus Eremiobacteraeota bacterium]|nr:MAG: Antilisterial bacteriocin subtilosin biosynthesis protein AlbA [bacterium ADurb.Bin363]HPZ06685.1 radical SAM protein [Candidatus Eremiobacteraeota bacterium]
MINISKLFCFQETSGDRIRYGKRVHSSSSTVSEDVPESASCRRPVTVWNITRTCNLKCIHCYTDSHNKIYEGELTTKEGKILLKDLVDFKIPAILFSGGEPLIRKDIFDLVNYANSLGLRCTLSTNGTLITEEIAEKIKKSGFTYVGISLDGIGEINDRFRGQEGVFQKAVKAFRNCRQAGQKVGLRLTLTKHNYRDLHGIFDFIEKEGIERACFYHLAYSGRGRQISGDDLSPAETRDALDIIIERTEDFHKRGLKKDILTVANHADGIYVYLKLLKKGEEEKAEEARKLLFWNKGGMYSSGVGIACIDFQGEVHPDQFWMHYSFGNIRERPFSQIWMDTTNPLMAGLKDRKKLIKGRCALCKWIDLCGASMRVRSDIIYGDPWESDPACYLSDEEIGFPG